MSHTSRWNYNITYLYYCRRIGAFNWWVMAQLSSHQWFSFISRKWVLISRSSLRRTKVIQILRSHIQTIMFYFLSTLRALSRLIDEYVRIEDNSGNKIIVYADNGNFYVLFARKLTKRTFWQTISAVVMRICLLFSITSIINSQPY